MYFSIENRKFYFRGEVTECFKECNGINEFSREVAEFDSTGKEAVYALAKMKMDTMSVAQNDPLPAKTTNTVSETNERIPLTAAGEIESTKQNTDFNFASVHSTQKNASLIIEQNILPRIPLVVAGNIELIKHNTVSGLAFVHSVKKNPSLGLQANAPQEIVQKRIPVLDAGSIVMSTKKTALLPRKRSLSKSEPYYIVQHNAVAIAQTKISPTVDTVSAITRNNSTPTDKVSATPERNTLAALPADYAERKKNVIRTIIVNTDSITLRVYDNGVVDGDIVSVILNDKVVIDKLSLTSRAYEVKVPVNVTSINNLVFHAHNLGEYPPNTAQLEILYGNKKEELTVSSDLTVSSMIDIIHQQ